MNEQIGRRATSALIAFALMAFASITIAGAVEQVTTGSTDGTLMCKSCGPNVNVQSKSGTATGGYANGNPDGTATNVGMGYTTPDDGTVYSGTASIVVTGDDGTIWENVTSGVTDTGNGLQMFTGLDNIYVPVGGSISIRVSETNWLGASFAATWNLRNYKP